MMKHECSIIRDLLPLYAENMVSADTAAFVQAHLDGCETCKKVFEASREPQPVQTPSGAAPLQKLSRKLRAKRLQAIALTAVFVVALFVSAFAVLDAPIYLPYCADIVTVEPLGDSEMCLTFDEKVAAFDCTLYDDPNGGAFRYCDIQAWTTLWDKWFSRRNGALTTTVSAADGKPVSVVYMPNDGEKNICVARFDPHAEPRVQADGGETNMLVLPRISLGYYLVLAVAALAACAVAWLLTRKRDAVRVWVERLLLYPLAYILSHFIVTGISAASYSMPRDFSLTLFISLLLYGGFLLAHNIWRLQREIKALNP